MRLQKLIISVALMWLLLSLPIVVRAQFKVGGHDILYNSTQGTFMCPIPDSLFGYDYETVIQSETIFRTKVVDGNLVLDTLQWESIQLGADIYHAHDTIMFSDVSGGKIYPLVAHFNDGSTMSYPISFTNLPIVRLDGQFGNDYSNGTVIIFSTDTGVPLVQMKAKIKWRGGSTNGVNKHKRNYTIKFLNHNGKKQKRQFFGLRTHNQWILNAGQVDLARCRNQVGHELWNDMARKPYYIDQAPDALTSVRGQFVEVFLNGEYRGIYSMTENIDQEQTQIVEHDEDNNIFHGHLWKTDSWDGTSMYDIKDYDNTQEVYRGFETKYPDFEDVNPTDYSILYNAINFTLNSTDAEFKLFLDEYFDIPVLIDYYLLINVLVAQDNNGKNMFWVCYDGEQDKKLTIAVWDLDCTAGQGYNPTKPHPSGFGPEIDMRTQNLLMVLNRMIKIPEYNKAVNDRYWELYQTHLNPDSLYTRYENIIHHFIRGGAAAREEQKWSRDSDIGGYELNLQQELDFIYDWIQRRYAFLNAGEFYRDNVSTNVENLNRPVDNRIFDILGQPVSTPVKSGIYIQNGKKIFIQP